MSLRVKHVNADTTFLLIFSPPYAPHNPQGTFPGSVSILIDPWLTGDSTIYHPSFARTLHRVPAALDSIRDLPDPDIVIVSQDKSDHCHEATLRELPPDSRATIVAHKDAAKRIRSWNHFDPDSVVGLDRFDPKCADSVWRMPIPALSDSGSDGELTISLLESRRDLTRLHNGIAITYRAPGSVLSHGSHSSYIDIPQSLPTPPDSPPSLRRPSFSSTSSLSFRRSRATSAVTATARPFTPSSATIYPSPLVSAREKTLSVLYTPHGVPWSLVHAYATTHLLAEAALPLTALLHCFNRATNPWYLGGNICAGAQAGVELARGLAARVWIAAHDEEKDDSGLGVSLIRHTRCHAADVARALEGVLATPRPVSDGGKPRAPPRTQVLELDAGDEFFMPSK